MLEAYVNILAIIVTIAGLIISLSLFPQAYKIYIRKSSADISLTSYLMLFFSLIPWLLYGISIHNLPLMITNSVSLLGTGLVLVAYFEYRVKK